MDLNGSADERQLSIEMDFFGVDVNANFSSLDNIQVVLSSLCMGLHRVAQINVYVFISVEPHNGVNIA